MATKSKETSVSTARRHPEKEGKPDGKPQQSENNEQTPRLPHEHDESSDSQSGKPQQVIKQAYDDIQEGQLDTDRRGMPGVEEVERKQPHHKQPDIPDSSRMPPSIPKK